MPNKISDVQRSILESAVLREDRLLPLPSNLKGGAAKRVGETLLITGFAKEVRAQKDAPVWRRDAATGRSIALKLTAAGIKDIEGARNDSDAGSTQDPTPEVARPSIAERATLRRPTTTTATPSPLVSRDPSADRQKSDSPTIARDPRPGSKLGRVLGLLRSGSGATLAELIDATGWLPHSARAALTGLRKRGYRLTLTRGERGDASVYRAVGPTGGARP